MKPRIIIFSIFAFLIPLFFLPLTIEYFETAKILLLSCFTLLILFLWGWRVLRKGELSIKRNPLLFSFSLFLLSIIISFLFSQDKLLSLYGYYGRFINTLPFYVILFLLFIGLTNILRKEKSFKTLIVGLILGLDVLGFWVVANHFNIFSCLYPKNWEFLQIPNFNMVGSSVMIPFLSAINLILSSYLFSNLKNRVLMAVGIISVAISSFVFAFAAGDPRTGSNWMLFIFLALGIIITVLLNLSFFKERKLYAIILLISLISSVIIVNINPFKKSLNLDEKPYTKEIVLDFNFGWRTMGGTLAASPARALFGSGPDTYIEDFAMYKPIEYNSTDLWAVRFSRGSCEFSELLTNLGIVSFTCLFALFFLTLRLALKTMQDEEIRNVFEIRTLAALVIALIIYGFFIVYNSAVWFILILALSGLVILQRERKPLPDETILSFDISNKLNITRNLMPYIFLLAIILTGVLTLPFFLKSYISDFFYRKSALMATRNNTENSISFAIKSVSWLSRKDYAHRQIALQSLMLLERISTEENPDQEAQKAFLNQTLRATEKMLDLAPGNIENWETASLIYQRLANLTDGQYFEQAVTALNNSISFDPLKPQFHESLGLLYARAKQFDLAKQYLEAAINLQPNFYRTYLSLAQLYELQEDRENAVKILEIAKSLLPKDSEIITVIDEKIEALQSPEPMDEK